MPDHDLYEVLGVDPDADEAELRRAFQKIARRCHPHVAPGDEAAAARFAEATRAFEILSDPALRSRYDAELARGREPEWTASWSAAEEVVESPGGTVRRSARWMEVRRGGPPAAREAGASAGPPAAEEGVTRVEAALDFPEAVRGTTRSFPLQREISCPECGGSGEVGGGGGEAWTGECSRCGGRGSLVELERVRVRLPRAIEDGARLRIPGRGAPLAPGRQSDLEIRVRVRPHPYFRREGLDVYADLPISLAEAVHGAEVEVPTIDGPVRVTIPPGTSGGRRFRLRGRGLAPPGGEPGDHYFRVTIVLPERMDEGLRRRIAELTGRDPRAGLPRRPL